MSLSQATLMRAALLAAAMVLTGIGAPDREPPPSVVEVSSGCQDINLPSGPLCVAFSFICIGGNADCDLMMHRYVCGECAAMIVDYHLVDVIDGSGRFAFAAREQTATVHLRGSLPAAAIQLELMVRGVVVHRIALKPPRP